MVSELKKMINKMGQNRNNIQYISDLIRSLVSEFDYQNDPSVLKDSTGKQSCNDYLESAMRYSIHRRKFQFAKAFLEFDINIDSFNDHGRSLIHEMVKKNNVYTLKFLIDNNADINIKDFHGATPLFHMAGTDFTQGVFDLLLENGACINHQDNEGFTPLMKACHNGDNEFVAALLSKNADIFIENNSGNTAIDIANQYNNSTIISLLKRAILTNEFIDDFRIIEESIVL